MIELHLTTATGEPITLGLSDESVERLKAVLRTDVLRTGTALGAPDPEIDDTDWPAQPFVPPSAQAELPLVPLVPAVPVYLTADELAAMLRVSRRTIGNRTRRRLIPYRRIGKRIMFKLAEVEAALVKVNAR